MDPDTQWALSHKYTQGARLLALPSGRWAVFDMGFALRGIYNSFPETLDCVTECNKIIHRAEPQRAKPKLTLEELGL